jgi:hypothetical protein
MYCATIHAWQIGAAQMLGLSKDTMDEIRLAAQHMILVFNNNENRRAQNMRDKLQRTIKRLAGKPSEFISGVNNAIVEARMILPKDDNSILSAHHAVKTAELKQNTGWRAWQANRSWRANHSHLINTAAQKTKDNANQSELLNHGHPINTTAQKAEDVAPAILPNGQRGAYIKCCSYETTSKFTHDDKVHAIDEANLTKNNVTEPSMVALSAVYFVGAIILSCICFQTILYMWQCLSRGDQNRGIFECVNDGDKRVEDMPSESAVAVGDPKPNEDERREKDAITNRRTKQKRRKHQAVPGNGVEEGPNLTSANNLALATQLTEARWRLAWASAFRRRPAGHGALANVVHQNLSEDLWLMVAKLLHRVHESAPTIGRTKLHTVHYLETVGSDWQVAGKKLRSLYVQQQQMQILRSSWARTVAESATVAKFEKMRQEKKKAQSTAMKTVTHTTKFRLHKKKHLATGRQVVAKTSPSKTVDKDKQTAESKTCAIQLDEQDAQSRTNGAITAPRKYSSGINPPTYRPKQNGNGSVTRSSPKKVVSVLGRTRSDQVVTIPASKEEPPSSCWCMESIVPKLVIDKTKPPEHKALSAMAKAFHMDSNKSKNDRVISAGEPVPSMPQRQVEHLRDGSLV